MQLFVLNTDFVAMNVIDAFESLIWTDRYYECGDFELYVQASKEIFDIIKLDYYLWNRESDRVMIVESMTTEQDLEGADYVTIKGRSLESILDRRIIWGQAVLSGNFQNGIKKLLTDAVINPKIAKRKIPNFIFEASTDKRITDLEVDAQYIGDNLYEVIVDLCKRRRVGWKVTLNDNNQFVFKLYVGDDRGYAQTKFPYVVFSDEFGNLLTSDHTMDKTEYKTIAYIMSGGEYPDVKTATSAVKNSKGVEDGGSGLNRREMFTDASDISTTETTEDGEEIEIPWSKLEPQLKERGNKDLDDKVLKDDFNGEINDNGVFKYKTHYFMGDVVDFYDLYGHSSQVRVVEFVMGQDQEGTKAYPTFKSLTEEDTEFTEEE